MKTKIKANTRLLLKLAGVTMHLKRLVKSVEVLARQIVKEDKKGNQ